LIRKYLIVILQVLNTILEVDVIFSVGTNDN